MKISIVGTGYVGLVSGCCFAEMGAEVVCVDVDGSKIERLQRGKIPIYEPGLEDLVSKNISAGRLSFTTKISEALLGCEIVFAAVGTPQMEDGSADLHYMVEAARNVGRNMEGYTLFVTKSTVPVGTSELVRKAISEELTLRGVSLEFDVASNPEFLKEGAAIKDFMSPDRVVVGVDSERARALMERLYKPFLLNNFRVIFMNIPSAEMTKYAANAMLATRISFMNEVANLCEVVGADVEMVRRGIGSDHRIGMKFLYPGIGYGGSCFPKDVRALARTGRQQGVEMELIEAVDRVNELQKLVLYNKMIFHFGQLRGLKIAIWGVAFKPETDDIREAPSIVLIKKLLQAGAKVFVYDPVAMEEGRKILGDSVEYGSDMYDILKDADALCLVTEWKEFRLPLWSRVGALMRERVVFDGRNIYDLNDLNSSGFQYYKIG